jgi:mRNA interferase MazF
MMNRGDLYRVSRPSGDPKRQRVYVIVSRQKLIESRFPSVICAPIFTEGGALTTQVSVGPADGLKHESWIHCDSLVSFHKSVLTNFVGRLRATKMKQLNSSLAFAFDLPIEGE